MKFVDPGPDPGEGGRRRQRLHRVPSREVHPLWRTAGGDGANGGSVVFVADEGRTSLLDLANSRILRGARGEHGRGKDQYGRRGGRPRRQGPDRYPGLRPRTEALIADLSENGQLAIVARGGKGVAATSTSRRPSIAPPDAPTRASRAKNARCASSSRSWPTSACSASPTSGSRRWSAAMSRAAAPRSPTTPSPRCNPTSGVVKIAAARAAPRSSWPTSPASSPRERGAGDRHPLPQARRALPGAPAPDRGRRPTSCAKKDASRSPTTTR